MIKTTIKAETERVTSANSIEDLKIKVDISAEVNNDEASEIMTEIVKAMKASPVLKLKIKYSDSDEHEIELDPDQQMIDLS